MAASSNNIATSFFPTISNEHALFAGTLRDWCDPLLQGHEPTPVPICPRCAICKCESLKDLSISLSSPNHHHRHHQPSCPSFRHHERAKTASKQRLDNKLKRRANSYDPSIKSDNHLSIIKSKSDYSSSPPSTDLVKRRKSISKIPVRISRTPSSSSTVTTPASEYSPASSIHERQSSQSKTKLPRPISTQSSLITNFLINTNQTRSNSDEDLENYDRDR
jgi:hypothetical protein